MLKEKLEKFLKGNGDNKKKIESLLFFLVLLIITIIAINLIWKEDKKESLEQGSGSKLAFTNLEKEEDSFESKLENILSNINGVGRVKVLLTYHETEELIPVYNQTDKTSKTNETDSSGGTRIIEEADSQKEVVFEKETIVTQKKISPKIEGAVITAEGANNPIVKANIIQAVEAATGLGTHKIQVFEKQNNSVK